VNSTDFNVTYPDGTSEWVLNVSSCSGGGCYQTGVFQPKNQTGGTPFFTIGVNGTTTKSIQVCMDNSTAFPDCMFWYMSTNRTLEQSVDLNITDDLCYNSNETIVTNLDPANTEKLWSFVKFDSCEAGTVYDFNFTFEKV